MKPLQQRWPPTGWQADTAEITSAALFGGMLSVSRSYYHRSSNQNIYLSVTLESPLEQQALLMMLSNPSRGGGENRRA